MRSALAIAAKDLRQRLRDRSVVVTAVLAPFGLAAIFALLIPGEGDFHARYAVADLDGGVVAGAFVEDALGRLVEAGIAEISIAGSESDLVRLVDARDVDAGFLIPAGLSAAALRGETSGISVIEGPDAPIAAAVARSVAERFAYGVNAVGLSVAVTVAAEGGAADPDRIAALQERALAAIETEAIAIADAPTDVRQLDQETFYVAGMSIFFLFFTAQFALLSLLAERRDGLLARILAAPVAPRSVLVGKAIVGFGVGVSSLAILIVASTVLLGANWGDPLGMATLSLAAVLAAMGVMSATVTLARSREQADGIGAVVAVTLGLVGGTFFPLWFAPPVLARLSLFTPHAWWMRGLGDLAPEGAGVAEVLPAALVLATFGVVFGGIALLRARELVNR